VNGFEIELEWSTQTTFESHALMQIHEALQYIEFGGGDKGYVNSLQAVASVVTIAMETRKVFNHLAKVKGTPGERGKFWKIEVWRNLQTVGEASTERTALWLTIVNVKDREKAWMEAFRDALSCIEFGPVKEVSNDKK
jgi:hypothetical protein